MNIHSAPDDLIAELDAGLRDPVLESLKFDMTHVYSAIREFPEGLHPFGEKAGEG